MKSVKLDASLMTPLSPGHEQLVLKEVAYTKQQLQHDLKLIRDWLNSQKHLPPSRLAESDEFLEVYLTSCKGSLETVKRKLEAYYSIRSYSEIYDSRDPMAAKYIDVRSISPMAVIPAVGENGIRLFIGKFANMEPDKFDYLNYARFLISRTEVVMRLSKYAARIYLMIDCDGASPSIVLKIRPIILKDLVFLLQNVVPLRVFKLSMINIHPYVAASLNNLIKPLLSKKLKERLHVTSADHSDILNYFTPEQLPRDYGGEASNPSLEELSDKWNKNECSNREWFMNELSERVDESMRVALDSPQIDSYFGVHGSLKKLEID